MFLTVNIPVVPQNQVVVEIEVGIDAITSERKYTKQDYG